MTLQPETLAEDLAVILGLEASLAHSSSKRSRVPLTVDEIIHAPIEVLTKDNPLLAERAANFFASEGFSGQGVAPIVTNEIDCLDSWALSNSASNLLFCDCLLARLSEESSFQVLSGVAGVGKTSFLQNCFLASTKVRAAFPLILTLDGRALQMQSSAQFSREAVICAFGANDTACKDFLEAFERVRAEAAGNSPPDLMFYYLEQKFGTEGGLVVLDHAELLNDAGEVYALLKSLVQRSYDELNVRWLFVESSDSKWSLADNCKRIEKLHLPQLTVQDLLPWLNKIKQRSGLPSSVTPSQVLEVTSGRISLLSDFEHFVCDGLKQPLDVIGSFQGARAKSSVIDCNRFMRRARAHPDFFSAIVKSRGRLTKAACVSLDENAISGLIATGVVTRNEFGTLVYANNIFRRRIEFLTSTDAILVTTIHGSFQTLLRSKGSLTRYSELSADAIAKMIGRERDPIVALKRLVHFLESQGFSFDPEKRGKIDVFIRDRGNARLWAPLHKLDAVGAFEHHKQPYFALVLQTGGPVPLEDGRCFIPVCGNSGFVEMVLRAKPNPKWSQMTIKSRIDGLIGLLEGIQPTLAQVLQRVELRRQRQLNSWQYSGSNKENIEWAKFLDNVGCRILAVLEGPSDGTWKANEVKTPTSVDNPWVGAFKDLDNAQLDAKFYHPSKRGLVVSGDDLSRMFPRLHNQRAAVYLHPVRNHKDLKRFVAFLFLNNEANAIDSGLQFRLSEVAPVLLGKVS